MPTTYKDQFFTVDPGSPPASGAALSVFRAEMTDVNDNEILDDDDSDLFNGIVITDVWRNDTLTINVPGLGNVTYTGTTFYLASGPAIFTPTDGQILRDGTFVSSTFVTSSTQMPVGAFGPTCFTPGALIGVPGGVKAVEEIKVGDLVDTLDDGPQPVRRVLRQTVRAYGSFAPIHIERGALGNDRSFAVSPEHRLLIGDWRAALLTGHDEVLIAAKHLVNGTSVCRVEGGTVTYLHLVFDRHQIIFGDGCPSESCLPGRVIGPQRAELLALYPELSASAQDARTARMVAKRAEVACVLAA